MAASAKPRQVLECLNLIGKPSHIEKLKSNEGCRMSVITMLTAQISKRNIANLNWFVIQIHNFDNVINALFQDIRIFCLNSRLKSAVRGRHR